MFVEAANFSVDKLVNYGEAEVFPIEEKVNLTDLYACVASILMDNQSVGAAHFPVGESFGVCRRDDDGIYFIQRTFLELRDILFKKYGPALEETRGYIFGGVKGKSEPLIKKINKELKDFGVKKIKKRGPHSKFVTWDSMIDMGNIKIGSRKKPQYEYGESSY